MPRASRLALAAVLAILPPAVRAGGAEEAEIRFISPTAATSDCIGDPKTPVCAVETMMACAVRAEASLCARVGIFDHLMPKRPEAMFRYQILSSRIIRQRDIPLHLREAEYMKPGYAEVTVFIPDESRPECRNGCKMWYNAKPTPVGWQLLGWMAEGIGPW